MQNNSTLWLPFPYFVKRSLDIVISVFAILFLLPFSLLISIVLLFSSGFPIFYCQERVGQQKRKFSMIKFRTMNRNSELDGPQLAQLNDERTTSFGKFMRKWRIDEIPQFVNVLKGDMCIVGPRPERAYFVEKLEQSVPNYSQIFSVKPGITSAGMVHFGYASTVEQMQQRAKFDLDYVNNLSLRNDCNILIQTVLVILNGKGK